MNKSNNISRMPLIVVAAAAFIGALDATFMNVSMSQVVIDLDTTVGTIPKMVSFYALITASLLLISAKLQDIIGKRKIFLLGIIIYGIGDLIAALSPNATVLFIGWSLLEGIGSALMGPALISIITETYTGIYRTKALAVVSTMAGVAVAIGPLFGGVVTLLFVVFYAVLKDRRVPRNMDELMVIPGGFGVAENDRMDLTVRSMEEVVTVSEKVQRFCLEKGLDKRRANLAGLSMEEMAGNVVSHGFNKDKKGHSVDIRVVYKSNGLQLRIKDDCVPFDPGERIKLTDPSDPFSNIGIRLVFQIAEDVEYQSILGLNALMIRI